MNPREQACAAVQAAQERRDTRALAKATGEGYRVTHEILGHREWQRASQAVASTVPAASLAGKLLSRALARIRGRS